MLRLPTVGVCLAAALLGLGCGDRAESQVTTPRVVATLPLDRDVVFVEAETSRVIAVDVLSDDPRAEPRVIPLSTSNPVAVQPRRGATAAGDAPELLVLCQGQLDDEQGPERPARFIVVSERQVAREWDLPARFDTFTQSDDGRYVILHYGPNARSSAADSLLFNPNEMAVIDLESEDGPVSVTLQSLGDVPERIVFSPELELAGERRRLAIVLMDSVTSVLDLGHLNEPEVMVTLATDGRELGLSQVVFDRVTNNVYLRGTSADLYVLQLLPEEGANDFTVSINQLGAGSSPDDMVLYGQDQRRVLALTSAAQQALVIDADSSRITSIPIEHPASDILLFRGEEDGTVTGDELPAGEEDALASKADTALLFGASGSQVSFLELGDLENRKGRNLETLQLRSSYSSVLPLQHGLVLFVHGGAGLSLLDLRARTVSTIDAREDLEDAIYDRNLQRLWVKPTGERLGFLGIDAAPGAGARTFTSGEVRLDAVVERVVPMTAGTPKRLIVTHPSEMGYLTILDAEKPDRRTAIALHGYLTAALAD